ncbi:MAG: ABC transporter ATP-binding protein [Firmicutes bacterium]|nr:ABC transporter ATP-binding protein [Bacillota bacterium]
MDFRSAREIVHALKKVNIRILPEKLTVLKGRSGSGKTTLINLLGGLDTPTGGKVFFKGRQISNMSALKRDEIRRKDFGFVFQSIAIISIMSAYENVEFGLRIAGYDPAYRKERAEECLKLVGLGKRMHHRAHELSGGEQQRVAIARAIAHRPGVIFADEPTAELDTHMGLQVVKLFKTLVEKEGLAVVMSTHDPSMMEVADCVYTLEDGEIIDERWAG